jgi:hypothetical protein
LGDFDAIILVALSIVVAAIRFSDPKVIGGISTTNRQLLPSAIHAAFSFSDPKVIREISTGYGKE